MKVSLRPTWPWGFLIAGVLCGSVFGEFPENPPVYRGGYRVLDGDFHVHTRFSDGFLSPLDVVLLARRKALDVLGLTEHNMVFPGKLARWFSGLAGGPVVIPGEEITTREYHLIALDLKETVPGGLEVTEAIARVHAQGGFAIAAHPVQRFWVELDRVLPELDGMEVLHPMAIRGRSNDNRTWRWRDMVKYYGEAIAAGHRITAIGSSDYHFFNALGVCRTHIFAENDTHAAIMDALRNQRTVVRAPTGETFGDPELIALLEREPLPEKKTTHAYDAEGWFDAFGRTLAWASLIAVIIFRRARAKLSV